MPDRGPHAYHEARQLTHVRQLITAALRTAVAGPVCHAAKASDAKPGLAAATVTRVLDGVMYELTRSPIQPLLAWSAGVRMADDLLPAAARLCGDASPGGSLVEMGRGMTEAHDLLRGALAAGRNASPDEAHGERLAQLAHVIDELAAIRREAQAPDATGDDGSEAAA